MVPPRGNILCPAKLYIPINNRIESLNLKLDLRLKVVQFQKIWFYGTFKEISKGLFNNNVTKMLAFLLKNEKLHLFNFFSTKHNTNSTKGPLVRRLLIYFTLIFNDCLQIAMFLIHLPIIKRRRRLY